jgi:uncharacterized membrane protein
VLAIVAFFALKLALGLLGFALGLFWNLLWVAAAGFVIYLVIKVVSPVTAARIHDAITGRRREEIGRD